jgi:hypothetical protein
MIALFGVSLVAAIGLAMRGASSAGTEFERIAAIGCGFLALVALVVRVVSNDGVPPRPRTHSTAVTVLAVFSAAVCAPAVIAICGVFVITLLPAIFLMLPFYAAWALERHAQHAPSVSGVLALAERRRRGVPGSGPITAPA